MSSPGDSLQSRVATRSTSGHRMRIAARQQHLLDEKKRTLRPGRAMSSPGDSLQSRVATRSTSGHRMRIAARQQHLLDERK
jgi:hypothetical protein